MGWDVVLFRKAESLSLFEYAVAIRSQVFVDEQHCDPLTDIDAQDETAIHALITDDTSKEGLATGRLFVDEKDPSCFWIGRMAVLKSARGSGVGRLLLTTLLAEAERHGAHQVICHAQVHALAYYEKQGFVAEEGLFLEENIEHRVMRKRLVSAVESQ